MLAKPLSNQTVPAYDMPAPQFAATTNVLLQSGAACPSCFSTTYFKKYTFWHILIAIFLFPIGLLFFFAPVRVCENNHKYGLGKWLIGIIQVLLFLILACVLAGSYYFARASSTALAESSATNTSTSNASVPTDAVTSDQPIRADLTSPEGTIRSFYADISSREYAEAYHLLGSDYRAHTTFDQFRAGYATTQSVVPTLGSWDRSTGTAQMTLDATDLKDGTDVATHYVGYWQLVRSGDGWKLVTGEFSH